ncbi:MAG: YfiM family protein [Bacteroidetes bacterium]|nr:YfiM family protein [Bacteroidota bacterium]
MQKIFTAVFLTNLLFVTSVVNSQEISFNSDSLQANKKNIYEAIGYTAAFSAGSLFLLSRTWYKDKEVVPFHFYNDSRGFLQVDKFGHSFGAYVYSYIGFNYLLNSGYTRSEALYLGATLGIILQTPIEIMDGIHEGYGFSWSDIAANTIGSALVFGQEVLFNEQIVKYKFSYSESVYSKKANSYLGKSALDRLVKDYNGHTYWLSMPVNKFVGNKILPSWLNIAAGYGANGMYGEFENIKNYNGVDIPETKRYRQYFLSLDIDWTKIKTDSKFLQFILHALTFIKLPFPAVEFNSMSELRWHWLYY